MSIVNRRNAIIGWAVWTSAKQILKRGPAESRRRVRRQADVIEVVPEGSGRSWRLRRRAAEEVVEEPRKKRRPLRTLVALLAATAVGAATYLRMRSGRGGDEAPSPSADGAPNEPEPAARRSRP